MNPAEAQSPAAIRTALAEQVRRRWFLRDCGIGLGAIAAGSLLADDARGAVEGSTADGPLAPKKEVDSGCEETGR